MAQCPSCGNNLDDDFGLVTCSNCGASVFIDMEGGVKVNDQQASVGNVIGLSQPVAQPEEVYEESTEHVDEPYTEFLMDQATEVLGEELPPVEYVEEPQAVEAPNFLSAEPSEEAQQEEMPTVAPPAPEIPVGEKLQESGDLSDLADFGNSESSSAKEGHLRFNIYISGIDTVSIREQVKEVMEDSRFLWDADRLLNGIDQGCMTVPDVPSVKAAVLIHRIKYLPVGVAWEQYDIHKS